MNQWQKYLQLFVALVLLSGLFGTVAGSKTSAAENVHPALAQLAAESPEQEVRVIVQQAGPTAEGQWLTGQLGGSVVKELSLINAFVAELPAQDVLRLAGLETTRWVSLDAPMAPAYSTSVAARDEFNSSSYGNNDGTMDWLSPWDENDYGYDDPAAGYIFIKYGQLAFHHVYVGRSIDRQVDLSGSASASFSFDWQTVGLDYGEYISVLVSVSGTGPFVELDRVGGYKTGSARYDISAFISPNTTIRFENRSEPWERGEYVFFDNVEIERTFDSPSAWGSSVKILDGFNTVSYAGTDGSISWASEWQEINESDGPGSGDEQIVYDLGSNRLRIKDNDSGGEGVQRSANLLGAISATLSFDYRRDGLDSYYEYVSVEVSADGGATWTELGRFAGPSHDNLYHSWQADISKYLSAQTSIRFVSSPYLGWDDSVYFDNVQIGVELAQNTFRRTMGVNRLHAEGITGQGVTVAVIDSGIGNHQDFDGRLQFATEYGKGDVYGHGTHVSGIIGGDGSTSGGTYTGVAPEANFIALGVSDATGMAYESDVVGALQWVFDNKDLYNIRVVNLSLNSTVEDSYHNSGIDAAAEILWFNGVVVVASAGNKGPAGGYNTAKSAPANDPFLIAVGASNEHATANRADDTITPYSAFGTTQDGFAKPDLIAPGHDIYSALSPDSSWDDDYPNRLGFAGQYFRLSGTSMAAPMVSGAVALLLQDEPNLTPNQVKYRLQNTSSTLVNDDGNVFSYVDIYAAVHGTTAEEANQGIMPHMLLAKMALIAYWTSQNGEENIDWENVNWGAVNWNAVNWNAVNWNAVNWNAVNWNAVNWNAVNWNAVNWNAVNWNAVNWNAVNWNAVNWNAVNWNAMAELDGVFWGRDKGKK